MISDFGEVFDLDITNELFWEIRLRHNQNRIYYDTGFDSGQQIFLAHRLKLLESHLILHLCTDIMSMPGAKSDIWIARRLNDALIDLRLFCFPYAGGGTITYQQWTGMLPARIEVCAVQLPGRERRHAEPPFRRISQAVDCLSSALRPHLDVPFVLFGHSMGAMLAYEVARRLLTDTGHEPSMTVS
jgi:hypothetical protein